MDKGRRYEEIGSRTLRFGISVIKISRLIKRAPDSLIVVKQFIRSGTSIGANVAEAQDASSRDEFHYKIGIGLREAKETRYWCAILVESEMIRRESISPLLAELDEIIKILTTICRKTKTNK